MKVKRYLLIFCVCSVLMFRFSLESVDAKETVSQNSTEVAIESTEDVTAPILKSFALTKNVISSGEKIEAVAEAEDDVSGVKSISVQFQGPNDKRVYVHLDPYYYDENMERKLYEDGKLHGEIDINQYMPSGEYVLSDITLYDNAGNYNSYYGNTLPETVKGISFQYSNTGSVDITAPIFKSFALTKNVISSGEKIEAVAEAEDDVSGVKSISVQFQGPNDKRVYVHLDPYYYDENMERKLYEDGKLHGEIDINQYMPSGEYVLSDITLYDNAGNYNSYYGNTLPETIKGMSFQYSNTESVDITAPVFSTFTILSNQVETPGVIEAVAEAEDDVSGVKSISVQFQGPNDKRVYVHLDPYYYDENMERKLYEDGKLHGEIDINQYMPSGEYVLSDITLYDNAGNYNSYYGATLPETVKGLSFNVINTGRTPDVTTGTSNKNIVDQIKNSSTDSLIYVDYSSNSIVDSGVFEAIKGTDRTVVFESDGVQWIVNGKDVVSATQNVDLKVSTVVAKDDYSNQGEIQQITKGSNAYVLHFADNGVLPGKMKIRIKLDYSMRNYLGTSGIYLYYYDPVKKEMQTIAENLDIAKDNYVEFEISHCSSYILNKGKLTNTKYIEPSDDTNDSSNNITDSSINVVSSQRKLDAVPKTSDRTHYDLLLIVLIVSGLMTLYFGKTIKKSQ